MRALVLAALTGCGFAPTAAQVDGPPAMPDAAMSVANIDAASPMDIAASVPCYAPDQMGSCCASSSTIPI